MDQPPRVRAEVLPPEPPHWERREARAKAASSADTSGASGQSSVQEAFHPASAAALVLVDNFWMIPEFAVATLWLTIPLSFLSVFAVTFLIQTMVARDRWFRAFLKALFFGVVAAVPFSVTGTPLGLALLALAGVRRLKR